MRVCMHLQGSGVSPYIFNNVQSRKGEKQMLIAVQTPNKYSADMMTKLTFFYKKVLKIVTFGVFVRKKQV